jgi:FeS assembly SUF system protein
MGFSILKLAEMESEDFSEPPEINADRHHPLWPGIKECLRSVYDPEIPVNIYELGLIYSVRINDNGHDVGVIIDMTLTSPGCPVAQEMPVWVRDAVLELGGISDATVDLVWEPLWSPAKMSETAKLETNINY